jgi:hypothetical protein
MGRSKDLTPTEARWLELARAVARPASPQLAAVRSALAERPMDPREAWEVLATRDLVDDTWVTRGPRDVTALPPRGAEDDGPRTLESVVTIACDPAGVARVDALALELARRLAPWREGEAATRVRWQTVPWTEARFPHVEGFAARPAFVAMELLYGSGPWGSKEDGALSRSVERAFRPVSGRPSGTVIDGNPPVHADDPRWMARLWDRVSAGQQCLYHVKNRVYWETSVALDLVIPPHKSVSLEGRRFRELLDPAEVLLEIWRQGYIVGDVQDDVVTVYAPERTPVTPRS